MNHNTSFQAQNLQSIDRCKTIGCDVKAQPNKNKQTNYHSYLICDQTLSLIIIIIKEKSYLPHFNLINHNKSAQQLSPHVIEQHSMVFSIDNDSFFCKISCALCLTSTTTLSNIAPDLTSNIDLTNLNVLQEFVIVCCQ